MISPTSLPAFSASASSSSVSGASGTADVRAAATSRASASASTRASATVQDVAMRNALPQEKPEQSLPRGSLLNLSV